MIESIEATVLDDFFAVTFDRAAGSNVLSDYSLSPGPALSGSLVWDSDVRLVVSLAGPLTGDEVLVVGSGLYVAHALLDGGVVVPGNYPLF